MRVIAGELGGRRLLAPKGWAVRPTSDRVREAIFSALGDVEGTRALDLYCGTGALGIEALSRGAERVTFVDRDLRPALGNIEHLGLAERSTLVRADVVDWLSSGVGSDPGAGFDLILLDPPYRLADRIGSDLDSVLPSLLLRGGRVIVEAPVRRPIDLPSLQRVRRRNYGSTSVTFFAGAG